MFQFNQVKEKSTLDALLSDICIGTSAAPTYLPAHYFKTQDNKGKVKEYNLIDGGVAANNPVYTRIPKIYNFFVLYSKWLVCIFWSFQTLVAMAEVTKEILKGNSDFFPIKPIDYGRFLVISLGAGSTKAEEKYNATEVAKWGLLGWLTSGGSTPLVDVYTQASGDMVDFHLSVVFKALHSDKYLRIQVQTFCSQTLSFQWEKINWNALLILFFCGFSHLWIMNRMMD